MSNLEGVTLSLVDFSIDPATGLYNTIRLVPSPDSNFIDQLKTNDNIGTNTSNSYILTELGAYLDSSNTLSLNETIEATAVTPDVTQAQLESWELDLNTGVISLTFDDVVQGGTADVTKVSLANNALRSSEFILSGDSTSTSTNSVQQVITLSLNDLNQIKSRIFTDGLAANENSSFIFMTAEAYLGYDSRDIIPITRTNPADSPQYMRDSVIPELSSFDLDMNTGVLTVTFNEPIGNIDYTVFTIQSSGVSSPDGVMLSGNAMSLPSSFRQVFTVTLLRDDVIAIKDNTSIATSQTNSFLFISSGSANDTSGNAIVDSVNQTSRYTPDTSAPIFESFTLDLDNGELSLTFDDAVDASTFMISQLELREAILNSNISQTVALVLFQLVAFLTF